MLGKEIRLKRLIPTEDNKYLGVTVDHAIGRGVLQGLDNIDTTLEKIVRGNPNSITMNKGIADKCFTPYVGKVPLVLKLTTFGVYHFTEDVQIADVEEAIMAGADAVSCGCIVGGDNQDKQIEQLAKVCKEAHKYGIPVISHIYPRGNLIEKNEQYAYENVLYAARAGAELGVDIIKTNYTGDIDSFSKIVDYVPTRVAIAGGNKCRNVDEYLQQTREVMDAGAFGVTYGRFVFQYEYTTSLIKALGLMIHKNYSLKDTKEALKDLIAIEEEEKYARN